jgi:hypothetical protein
LNDRPAPTGTGTFQEGTTVLGTSAIANGSSSVGLSQLTLGSHAITFQYSGDANFQPNLASTVITITTVPAPDFSISSSPASLTITRGQTVKAELTITANAGLSGSVTFACSGLPAESACTFDPANLTASPGKANTTTLSISTTAPSSAVRQLGWVAATKAMTALALFLFVPFYGESRRQWVKVSLLVVVFGLGVASITGCGGGGSSQQAPSNPGSPTGSSTVMVTATSVSGDATITHTLPLTVVIQ